MQDLNFNVQSVDWPAGLKWAMAGAVSLWASVPVAVQTLLLLMVVDYATGLLSAAVSKTLSSAVGLRGLAKKTATLLLVITAHVFVRSMHLPFDFGGTLAMGFVVNEVISIVENVADIGVPVPPGLLDLLLRARKVTGRGQTAAEVKAELEAPEQKASSASSGV